MQMAAPAVFDICMVSIRVQQVQRRNVHVEHAAAVMGTARVNSP